MHIYIIFLYIYTHIYIYINIYVYIYSYKKNTHKHAQKHTHTKTPSPMLHIRIKNTRTHTKTHAHKDNIPQVAYIHVKHTNKHKNTRTQKQNPSCCIYLFKTHPPCLCLAYIRFLEFVYAAWGMLSLCVRVFMCIWVCVCVHSRHRHGGSQRSQGVAACCSVLQRTYDTLPVCALNIQYYAIATICVWQCVAACCSVLQRVYDTLHVCALNIQYTYNMPCVVYIYAAVYLPLQWGRNDLRVSARCSMLHCVASCLGTTAGSQLSSGYPTYYGVATICA